MAGFDVDLFVIGGGSGGVRAARIAALHGAKVMVAELDAMPRTGPDFMPRLMALEAAIKAHVGEEENSQYPKLMRTATPAMNAKMTADFRREFTRYIS